MTALETRGYFDENSTDPVARSMLAEISSLRARHKAVVNPTEVTLLLLDLQTYFADPSSHAFVPSLMPIVPRVVRLARAFHAAGRPVIATRHADSVSPSSPMRRWWRGAIEEGSEASRLIAPVAEVASDAIVKSAYDAFLETPLLDQLRAQRTRQLVICGVHAHLCCETTARSAFMKGFDVLVPVDGIATTNEAFHRASLLNLAHGFAFPVLCADVHQAMETYANL